MRAVTPAWHEFAMQLNFSGGLAPYFACHAVVRSSGGSREIEFTHDGERWLAKLYYQSSGIAHPGRRLPTGTEWDLDTVREFRVKVMRHPSEDGPGQQSFNAHLRPRWQGMQVERSDGETQELSLPPGMTEGVNVRVNGSNIRPTHYLPLLRDAARALDVNPDYSTDPDTSSTVRDAERYVRLLEDASGPVHARDGPIAKLGHLLENDRSGYRKVVQNDTDGEGNDVPGYYHTATLGPGRVAEAWPNHELPKEIKHYRARHADSLDEDNPLRHPKVGASYQVNRWDESLGVTDEDLVQLEQELDEALHSILRDAGVPLVPPGGDGAPPYQPDPYFPAEIGEHVEPPKLNLTELESEQEHVVIRELAKTGGVSPVEGEVIEYLLADGGTASAADIAEEHGRHVGSVRRALRRMDDLIDRKYGEVALASNHVAEMLHSAVAELRDASTRLSEATGEALVSATRGLDETTSALRTWLAKHDCETESRGEAIKKLRLGEVEALGRTGYADAQRKLKKGLSYWTDAGRDPAYFKNAKVLFRRSDRRSTQVMDAARLLELREHV
ncbi:helix-turn-helix domain-containing protein [Halobaculum saliterrae]|uniref:helix-turn-helix domain-containing protein n=1 Tax=Halobaculum saliterrae TaxID=2073113 RepID=UPI00191585F3|nr:helix-turn-helix domain-containing protein [Halobaculum saliterrae]